MTVGSLSLDEFAHRLARGGATFRAGPFAFRLRTGLAELAEPLYRLYADFPLADGTIVDYHVRVRPPGGMRRWFHPQVIFVFDGTAPFHPFPRRLALPFLEWGLNWCIYRHAHQYLFLHAAVVEKDGRGLILPGGTGAGKSTLSAALISRGWRLLSDELAIIPPETGELLPLARPISLKNGSIDAIRRFAPDAEFGPLCRNTHKGDLTHMRPPTDSVRRVAEAAEPAWIIFPRYEPGADCRLDPVSKAATLFRISDTSLNSHVLGAQAFEALGRLVDRCSCHELRYSSLDDGIAAVSAVTSTSDGR